MGSTEEGGCHEPALCVVDVRTILRSRHNAQFNQETLPLSLRRAGIGYIHIRELGGTSAGAARFFEHGPAQCILPEGVDYMQTSKFEDVLKRLVKTAAIGGHKYVRRKRSKAGYGDDCD